MKTLKNILGYIWAASAIILVPVVFAGGDGLSKKLVEVTGLKVSPMYTGGETLKTIEKPGYKMTIQKPVFPALIGESAEGFVQIIIRPEPECPGLIKENIDCDGDSKDDFGLSVDTKKNEAEVSSSGERPASLIKLYNLNKGWAARIKVANYKK